MRLHELPSDILILLRKYFSCDFVHERFPFVLSDVSEIREGELEWMNIVNTCKSLTELKRTTIALLITRSSSLRYLKKESFRNKVDNVVNDKTKQLYFRNSNSTPSRHDPRESHLFLSEEYYLWNNCYGITFDNVSNGLDVSSFSKVLVLNIYQCSTSFVFNLNRLQHLTVSTASELKSISNLPSLQRLRVISCRALNKIADLPSLRRMYIDNYQTLTTLSIPQLEELEVIHFSQPLHTEHLMTSTKSHLGIDLGGTQVVEAALSNLGHLVSVRMINGNLQFCALTSAIFSTIETLTLSNCSYPIISHLNRLAELDLSDCQRPVVDCQSLPTLRRLRLCNCKELQELKLSATDHSSNIMQRVDIINCDGLQNLIIGRKIRNLTISQKEFPKVIMLKPTMLGRFSVNNFYFTIHDEGFTIQQAKKQ